MREIKFRAWDGQKILPPVDLTQPLKYYKWLGKNDLPLMQFTGLLDKNGKEIYEGDILKLTSSLGVEIVEVKPLELFECDAFVVYGYKFCSNFFIENYEKIGLDSFYSENPEVIGNIYENKDLLSSLPVTDE